MRTLFRRSISIVAIATSVAGGIAISAPAQPVQTVKMSDYWPKPGPSQATLKWWATLGQGTTEWLWQRTTNTSGTGTPTYRLDDSWLIDWAPGNVKAGDWIDAWNLRIDNVTGQVSEYADEARTDWSILHPSVPTTGWRRIWYKSGKQIDWGRTLKLGMRPVRSDIQIDPTTGLTVNYPVGANVPDSGWNELTYFGKQSLTVANNTWADVIHVEVQQSFCRTLTCEAGVLGRFDAKSTDTDYGDYWYVKVGYWLARDLGMVKMDFYKPDPSNQTGEFVFDKSVYVTRSCTKAYINNQPPSTCVP